MGHSEKNLLLNDLVYGNRNEIFQANGSIEENKFLQSNIKWQIAKLIDILYIGHSGQFQVKSELEDIRIGMTQSLISISNGNYGPEVASQIIRKMVSEIKKHVVQK